MSENEEMTSVKCDILILTSSVDGGIYCDKEAFVIDREGCGYCDFHQYLINSDAIRRTPLWVEELLYECEI